MNLKIYLFFIILEKNKGESNNDEVKVDEEKSVLNDESMAIDDSDAKVLESQRKNNSQ